MAAGARLKARDDIRAMVEELLKQVEGEVRFDPFSRILYSTDASIYQMEPVGVVVPKRVDDVLAVMDVARRYKVPVLPRGGGTSLSGQTVNHAIVLDFSKYMNRVVEVNPEERWARVQPGIVLDTLNLHLRPYGLHFTSDPTTANRACIGGAIGNNSCGAHSILYGKTSDQVRELKVILSDGTQATFAPVGGAALEAKLSGQGLESHIYREVRRIAHQNRDEILRRFPKIMRRVSGYSLDAFIDDGSMDLTQMVVGSEGTLCVVTEARVNLEPRPKQTAVAVLHFKTLIQSMEATPQILAHQPSAVELVDKFMLDKCRGSLGFAHLLNFVEGDPGALLLVEFYGESDSELKGKLEALEKDVVPRLAYTSLRATTPAQQANVWSIRKAALGLLMSQRGDAKPLPFVEDTAVDPGRLAEYVQEFDRVVREHNTEAAYYGHASVGCLHIRPLVNLKAQEGVDKMVSIAEDICDLVIKYGGSLSGEHGDGIVRGVWNERLFGSQIYQAFREVKRAFDPDNILNPGKIIDCPPMTENLRYGPSYKTLPYSTTLDFTADFGYAGAVEMCNGMGACRKMDGTMCPSYMVTREEEHSTRGRANLLRAVLSGALPAKELTGHRLYQALDLCLECKGCKAECPSAVDMAKLKYEFLSHYNQANGVPLRARLFASINTLSRVGSLLAPLSNWALHLPFGRTIQHNLLGIHRNRSLPPFARPSLPAWFRRHQPLGDGHAGTVVLFNDTFMNYNYPQVGMAAVEVLEMAGFRVVLANARCCGRPMISKGLLDKARANARYNVDLLYQHVQQGATIVGCEPSCLLTLRDEYPDLLRDDRSRKVAENSLMIDEFLVRLQEKGALGLKFKDLKKQVLFHGHCHQKALVGLAPSLKTLRLPPGYQVEESGAGCCGMAGAFGYEKEHYDISMAIGEQRLFPKVRSKGQDWEVAVMGISCRQQIEHATGRRARHLVEVLRDAL